MAACRPAQSCLDVLWAGSRPPPHTPIYRPTFLLAESLKNVYVEGYSILSLKASCLVRQSKIRSPSPVASQTVDSRAVHPQTVDSQIDRSKIRSPSPVDLQIVDIFGYVGLYVCLFFLYIFDMLLVCTFWIYFWCIGDVWLMYIEVSTSPQKHRPSRRARGLAHSVAHPGWPRKPQIETGIHGNLIEL